MQKLLFIFLGLWAFSVQAATIQVTTTDDMVAKDNKCSLREAVQAANENRTIDTCTAGSVNYTDVIQLHNQSYLLNFNYLTVNSNVIIAGKGRDKTEINGQNRTRLFFVTDKADLQLQDVSLVQGKTTQFGGAILNANGTTTLYHSLLKQNLATGTSSAGGAIFNFGGTVNLNYVLLENNVAQRGYGGGAVFNYQGQLNVENSQFIGNQATTGFGGAGIYNSEGTINILNSQFSANNASFGGGVFNWEGIANLANVTLSNNQATFGAAINTYAGSTYVNYATIMNNTATYAGAIDNDGQFYLTASIVLNNQSKVGAADCHNGSNSQIHIGAYNAFSLNNGCGQQATDVIVNDADQQLDLALQLNQALQPTPLTHAVLKDSALINAIPAQDCRYRSYGTNPLFSHNDRVLVDQRNAARDYQQSCDIGAYEFAAVPPTKIDSSPSLPSTHYLTVNVQGKGHVTSYPIGINCGTEQSCREAFYTGSQLMLTAEPAEGYQLQTWQGDCATRDTRRLTRSIAPAVVEPPVNQTVRLALDTHKQCTAVFGR